MTRLATDAALLYAGHLLLRRRAISSRTAYALMGGVMAAAGYAIALRNSLQLVAHADGNLLTMGLLPTAAGMISGFLYGQFAGLAPAEDYPPLSDEGLATSWAFDGPTRVRTSVAAIAIAAVLPTALITSLSIALSALLPGLVDSMRSGSNPAIAAAMSAQLFLTFLAISVVPSAILVLSLHHIARSLHRSRAMDYATGGAAMAVICFWLLMPMLPMLPGFPFSIAALGCGAMMGAVYRRFAGLEPLPLPEAVIATDPDALVGAHDPARRQHRVIVSR